MKIHILCTGGLGYLGSVLWPTLKSADYRVDVMDTSRYNQPSLLFYGYDITNDAAWDLILKMFEPDGIVHLAALVGEDLCKKYPEEARRTNVGGTEMVAKICKENGIRLLFASTCSNYGITEGVATEETPLKPLGLYAETKVEAEQIVAECSDYTILRFGTLYGVSPRMRWDLMINEWIYDAFVNGKIKVYNPNAYRPFCKVSHACDAIKLCLEKPEETHNQTFNVVDFNISKRNLGLRIADFSNAIYGLLPSGRDSRDYEVSSEKFQKATGFKPTLLSDDDLRELKMALFVPKTSNAKDFVMT